MKSCSVIVLWFALSAAALAVDLPFKKKPQEFQTRKPDEVAQTLSNGSPRERSDLAAELGILAPVPAESNAKPNSPCVDFGHVEQRPVVLRAGAENVVMLADSSQCDSTYVVVFDKAPKSEWRHVQTVRLPARSKRPDIGFQELVQPGVSEIVVRHETTRDASAVSQQNFVVLKLLHDRVVVVMDATEHSELTLANRKPGETDLLQQTQTSTFDIMKSPPDSAAAYRIVEKEVITGGKTSITRYRLWSWNPELERFRPVPYDAGVLQAAPPSPKKAATPPAKPSKK